MLPVISQGDGGLACRARALVLGADSRASARVSRLSGDRGEGWFAFTVPAGTPRKTTALPNREIVKLISLPDIKEKTAAPGFVTVGATPEESAALFRTEGAKWAKVIREADIKGD